MTVLPDPVVLPAKELPGAGVDRGQLVRRLRDAQTANVSAVAEVDQIAAGTSNPAVAALARQVKAQAAQLDSLIVLTSWLARKSDSTV